MEYFEKKNIDENIHIIIIILLVILIIVCLVDYFKKPLLSNMYPFKGFLDQKISTENYDLLKERYDYYSNKFLKRINEETKDFKDKIIKNEAFYPILNKIVLEYYNEISNESDKELVSNMFLLLNSSIKDLDKDKIKETLKSYYFGPLPEILLQ